MHFIFSSTNLCNYPFVVDLCSPDQTVRMNSNFFLFSAIGTIRVYSHWQHYVVVAFHPMQSTTLLHNLDLQSHKWSSIRMRSMRPHAMCLMLRRRGLFLFRYRVKLYIDLFYYSRTMAVLDPLKVTIDNWDTLGIASHFDVPDFPGEPNKATEQHSIACDKVVYIDRSDYRSVSCLVTFFWINSFRFFKFSPPICLAHCLTGSNSRSHNNMPWWDRFRILAHFSFISQYLTILYHHCR